ncbi:alpha/beta hydrolase fold domain-containing protein, partial [Kibdelosporangium lantanae]
DPDPWLPTDTAIGITDDVGAALQAIAVLGFVLMNTNLRIVSWIALLPVLVIAAVAVLTAGAGAGLPARLSTVHNGTNVEYCRPDGVPLPMDIYTPAQPRSSAPVAVYVHGGGFMLGDQESDGLGASLANSPGALFAPLRDRLTASGFVVASVGYRLASASPWPGPITDVKCAIRFLRAHATELDINPKRIGVWGSSAGGTLVSLLGTTDTSAGFDVGEYTDQTSEVQAVVDMFGAADLTDHITGFAGTTIHIALNNDVLRAASPSTYLRAGMPPFLILHGTDDPMVQQSVNFATTGGSPTHRASGWIYGMTEDASAPADHFYRDVGFRYMRAGGAQLDSPGGWVSGKYDRRWNATRAQLLRTRSLGGEFVLLVHDLWGADGYPISRFPGDNGNWTDYDNFLTRVINDVRASGAPVQWDIWNEPNITTFWNRPQSQYFELWRRAYVPDSLAAFEELQGKPELTAMSLDEAVAYVRRS